MFLSPKNLRLLFLLCICTSIPFSCEHEYLECSNCSDSFLKKDTKVSILGDSYSTFQGYLYPSDNLTYYPNQITGVSNVSQTWWYQFITNNQLILEYNNSYGGSTIAQKSNNKRTSFVKRYLNLGNPELIFIFGGTNDSWQKIPLGNYKYESWEEEDLQDFRPAFAYLLSQIQQIYPNAKIVNLINTDLHKDYKTSMEVICQYYHICNISLGDFEKKDNHPSKKGMESICQQITQILVKQTDYHNINNSKTVSK